MLSTTPTTATTTIEASGEGTIKLRLRYGTDYVEHTVSTAPARDCTPSEIPVIDLGNIDGDLTERTKIAEEVRSAAEQSGFFYIKNHGIGEDVVKAAYDQAVLFFKQPAEIKELAARTKSKHGNNGWCALHTSLVNPEEGLDRKESFGWSYSPDFDPMHNGRQLASELLKERSHDEPHLWSGTAHLPNFKSASLSYWSACLTLARKLQRILALSLSLPEDYFDSVTTFPGADGVYNLYPAAKPPDSGMAAAAPGVGIGSHTDLQCFTLLWQDMSGGLQILNRDAQWVWATPMEGTFVVNIGDFLMRLTNDRYKSTVHRAYNRGRPSKDRISMPFFFGFNHDAICSVLPSCIDDGHPAKYEPISCGRWREQRFEQASKEASDLISKLKS